MRGLLTELGALAGYPAADLLLAGLVDLARSRIFVSNTEWLLSRCIDPLRDEETAEVAGEEARAAARL